MTPDRWAAGESTGVDARTDGGGEMDLTDEEARQVAAVLDVCLERGFDVEDVDRPVLERARDRLRERD